MRTLRTLTSNQNGLSPQAPAVLELAPPASGRLQFQLQFPRVRGCRSLSVIVGYEP